MKPTYLFYDIETSGLSKSFDQVLQFAAIRTDDALNEIDRVEYRVKLNPDIIPHPAAVITHRISIDQMLDGAPEFEVAKQIHDELNRPGTISLGYNTLNFDDEFLRFTFYRNLLPPYTHQFSNNCYRMDIYPMTIAYRLFKPDILNWPTVSGKHSLKLEHLNSANDNVTGQAHDAMVDVEATLALARRLAKEKKMWDYLQENFQKNPDMNRLKDLPYAFDNYQHAILLDGIFGAGNLYHAPVLGLGTHHHYHNQTLWLRLDDPALIESAKTDPSKCWVQQKKFGESPFLLPATEKYTRHLSDERNQQCQENLDFLKNHLDTLETIAEHFRDYTHPNVANADIDSRLYLDGFMQNSETRWAEQFHTASTSERVKMLDTAASERCYDLALRIMGRNYPDSLTGRHLDKFHEYLALLHSGEEAHTPINHQNRSKLTQKQLDSEIALLREKALDPEQEKLLLELEAYV